MKEPAENSSSSSERIAAAAAMWVMRFDRGLSPSEQDDYLQWLAADPRHSEAMARYGRTWGEFDRLAGLQMSAQSVPDPDLLVPRSRAWRRRWRIGVALPLAAAAALTLVFHIVKVNSPTPRPRTTAAVAGTLKLDPIAEKLLEDGTSIRLNRGATVSVDFSADERRVRLESGEAAFEVTKDPARPFVVVAGGVVVRAVGTAFNVRRSDHTVDIIVTEGSVAVEKERRSESDTSAPLVVAGQRAVVSIESAAPVVSTPSAEEVSRRLAWQPRLLTFTDEPLPIILKEFNRHNPVTLRSDDPALQELRLSARFRSDNVEGFLRLLESEFRVRAHVQAAGEISLRTTR